MTGPVYQPLPPFTNAFNSALQTTSSGGPLSPFTTNTGLYTSTGTPMEQAMAKRLAEIEAMIQRIPGVPTPLKISLLYSYIDSPFVDSSPSWRC